MSFAGPKRVNPPGIAFEDLPPIDVVLVSHNHYDHLDLATLARLQAAHDPLIVTPLGNDTIIRAAAPARKSRRMTGATASKSATASPSMSSRRITGRRAARATAAWRCGAASSSKRRPARSIFAGDTGFHGGVNYRAWPNGTARLRLAILPIGAYEPRWFMEPQHQNPEEAVEACCSAMPPSPPAAIGARSISPTSRSTNRADSAAARGSRDIPADAAGEVWDVRAG